MKGIRRHLGFGSIGDEGESVGEEKEVEEDEVVRLEVSSAPEDVTSCEVLSWEGFERRVSWGMVGASREISEPGGLGMMVLMLRDFL